MGDEKESRPQSPDFVAIDEEGTHWFLEAKGQENVDVIRKDNAAIRIVKLPKATQSGDFTSKDLCDELEIDLTFPAATEQVAQSGAQAVA